MVRLSHNYTSRSLIFSVRNKIGSCCYKYGKTVSTSTTLL